MSISVARHYEARSGVEGGDQKAPENSINARNMRAPSSERISRSIYVIPIIPRASASFYNIEFGAIKVAIKYLSTDYSSTIFHRVNEKTSDSL